MCGRSARGFTLVEIVVLIVVIAAALVGVLLVFQNTVRGSADPQIHKQALAIAEAMLDEILQSPFDPVPGGGGGTRANFNDIQDYHGYNTTPPGGMVDIQGSPIPGLSAYNVAVTVADVSLTNTPPPALAAVPEAKRVTVTVTGPSVAISLDGYRTRYAGP